jgi:hypothetical protein
VTSPAHHLTLLTPPEHRMPPRMEQILVELRAVLSELRSVIQQPKEGDRENPPSSR